MQKGMEQKKAALSLAETKESNTDEFRFTNYSAALEPGKITGIQRCARRTSYMRWGMGENHDIKNNVSILHALSYGNIDVGIIAADCRPEEAGRHADFYPETGHEDLQRGL